MRWWIVGAWAVAALVCGLVAWRDAHFVIGIDGRRLSGIDVHLDVTFGWSEMAWRGRAPATAFSEPWTSAVNISYRAARDAIRDGEVGAVSMREIFGWLLRSGAALFVLLLAAPLLGVVAMFHRHGSPGFRHALLVLAALTPLVALEQLGAAVGAYRAEIAANDDFMLLDTVYTAHATATTWCARVAWSGLAVAAAASWWRTPKPRRATPVDPGVFE